MAGDLLLPLLFAGVLLYGLWRRVDVFAAFTGGAGKGLSAAVGVLPALVALVTAVGLLKASGGLELLTRLLAPLAGAVGLPAETVPLVLVRPVSGSGAMAVFSSLLETAGPDSFAGRVGSVIFGATETVFYTVVLYLGSAAPRDSRRCALAGLLGTAGAVAAGVLVCRLFPGG